MNSKKYFKRISLFLWGLASILAIISLIGCVYPLPRFTRLSPLFVVFFSILATFQFESSIFGIIIAWLKTKKIDLLLLSFLIIFSSLFFNYIINNLNVQSQLIDVASLAPIFNLIGTNCFLYLMFLLNSILLYLVFRQGMDSLISFFLSVILIVSSCQIDHLIPFWEKYYVRAPFILSLIITLSLIMKTSLRPNIFVFLGVSLGFCLGIGLYFRPDLMFFLPLIIFTLLFWSENNIKEKLLSSLFVIFMTFGTWQAAINYSKAPTRSNSHAFLGGTSIFFDEKLGIKAFDYNYTHLHLDEYTSSLACANSQACTQGKMKGNLTAETDFQVQSKAQDEQMLRVFLNFPADALLRYYATMLRVIEIPFDYTLYPSAISLNPLTNYFYELRHKFLISFNGMGKYLLILTILIMAILQPKYYFFSLLLFFTLCLLPFIHIIGYYFFYIEFLGLWCLGFTTNSLVGLVFDRKKILSILTLKNISFSFINVLILFFISLIFLFISREYQKKKMSDILTIYQATPTTILEHKFKSLSKDRMLIANDELYRSARNSFFKVEELKATFDSKNCSTNTIFLTLRYNSESPRMNFSRALKLSLASDSATQLFFPAFFHQSKDPLSNNYFVGIEIQKKSLNCFVSISKITNISELPILMTLKLPADEPYYKVFQDYKTNKNLKDVNWLSSFEFIFLDKIVSVQRDGMFSISGHIEDNIKLNQYFPLQGPSWSIASKAYPDSQALLVDTDLILTKSLRLKKNSYFVVKGRLFSGGLLFTLLKDGETPIDHKVIGLGGSFDLLFRIPEDGDYNIGISNYVSYYNTLENQASFFMGILHAD